jgi:hypothetical protein
MEIHKIKYRYNSIFGLYDDNHKNIIEIKLENSALNDNHIEIVITDKNGLDISNSLEDYLNERVTDVEYDKFNYKLYIRTDNDIICVEPYIKKDYPHWIIISSPINKFKVELNKKIFDIYELIDRLNVHLALTNTIS